MPDRPLALPGRRPENCAEKFRSSQCCLLGRFRRTDPKFIIVAKVPLW